MKKAKINSWQFATCPTEETEPFFWRWGAHGLEMVELYVNKEISQACEEERERFILALRQLKQWMHKKSVLERGLRVPDVDEQIDKIIQALKGQQKINKTK